MRETVQAMNQLNTYLRFKRREARINQVTSAAAALIHHANGSPEELPIQPVYPPAAAQSNVDPNTGNPFLILGFHQLSPTNTQLQSFNDI